MSSTSQKIKFPRDEALKVAQEIYDLLKPSCARCKVAGSLRRRKPFVGDIEIIFIGTPGTRKVDLLTTEPYSLGHQGIDALLAKGIIAKRSNSKGQFAWGDKNRLAVHVASGIPIDFFATTEPAFFNYLVCRTGGSQNNQLIAEAYQRLQLRWNPYGIGYSDRYGREYPNTTEEDVYHNCKLAYLPPDRRP